MKNNIILLSISLLTLQVGHSQTTVSGGIYSNTTWSLANSPYIADSVVVFPNVTLTIQPGVVVNVFGGIEIRQSTLIAEGTLNDSITFIGDTSVPYLATLWLNDCKSSKFSHCVFKYGSRALKPRLFSPSDSLIVRSSTFLYNDIGIYNTFGLGNWKAIIIDSCIFINNETAMKQVSDMFLTNSIIRNNQNGLLEFQDCKIQNCIIDSNVVIGIESWGMDTINKCQIRNNGTGLKCTSAGANGSAIYNNIIENNDIGIKLSQPNANQIFDSIFCNKICNNTTYNLQVTTPYNVNMANNYWCTSDSSVVAIGIYDGYDNISLGLVSFTPIDTFQCYLITGIEITETNNQKIEINIFPNPFSTQTIFQTDNLLHNATLTVDNCVRQSVKQMKNISGQTVTLTRDNLPSGLYFIRLTEDSKIITTKKLLITD